MHCFLVKHNSTLSDVNHICAENSRHVECYSDNPTPKMAKTSPEWILKPWHHPSPHTKQDGGPLSASSQ